jgi:peptidoglycan-associated lipoprotein
VAAASPADGRSIPGDGGVPVARPGARARPPLRDIFFDTDRATIEPEAKATLDRNVKWLRANPSATVVIEGHCDERGTVEYNLALGERRAQAAREYLVAAGINPERISTVSYGKERPFVLGHDEDAWRWNRRAHFRAK